MGDNDGRQQWVTATSDDSRRRWWAAAMGKNDGPPYSVRDFDAVKLQSSCYFSPFMNGQFICKGTAYLRMVPSICKWTG